MRIRFDPNKGFVRADLKNGVGEQNDIGEVLRRLADPSDQFDVHKSDLSSLLQGGDVLRKVGACSGEAKSLACGEPCEIFEKAPIAASGVPRLRGHVERVFAEIARQITPELPVRSYLKSEQSGD